MTNTQADAVCTCICNAAVPAVRCEAPVLQSMRPFPPLMSLLACPLSRSNVQLRTPTSKLAGAAAAVAAAGKAAAARASDAASMRASKDASSSAGGGGGTKASRASPKCRSEACYESLALAVLWIRFPAVFELRFCRTATQTEELPS